MKDTETLDIILMVAMLVCLVILFSGCAAKKEEMILEANHSERGIK